MKSLLDTRPRNASPVPLVGRAATWATRFVNRTDTRAQLATYEAVSTLHAIVEKIATATAGVRWCLYKYPKSGDPEGRKEITRHPALDLWNRPNPFQTRMAFVEAFMQHLELAGEADWVVSRAAGTTIPAELWLVRPDRMTPAAHPTEFLTGWVYTAPDGETVPLGKDEVVQIKTPNPLDPYRGLSPVSAAMVDLEAWQLAAQWNLNFFHNSAQPGGIIQVPNRLTDELFNEMRDRWREQHQGVQNSHRVAILENATYVPNGYSMKDMDFVALRGLSSEIIREAYGFPKPMLGGTEDVNKAAAWAAQVIFARWLIKPRLERIREALNTQVLPLYGSLGDRLCFEFENPIPEDREDDDRERTSISTAVSQLVTAGAYLPDVLAAYGLPAIRLKDEVVPPTPEPAADPDQPTEPDPGDPSEGTEPPEQGDGQGDDGETEGPEDVREMLRTARRAAARLTRGR